MTVYLGQLGRMIELWSVPSSDVSVEEQYSFHTTLEGVRRAQRRPLGRREWSINADYSTPHDSGVLADFASGAWGNGPWRFVPADAPNSNMLTPEAASCSPAGGMGAADSPDGPMNTPDGWAPRSILSSNPSVGMSFGNEYVPVLGDGPVTVSAYLLGADAAVRVFWYDAAGVSTGTHTSTVRATAGTVVRSWITATPPPGSASLRVRASNASRGCRPAVTVGDVLHPWADGRGCLKAVVVDAGRSATLAGSGFGRQSENVSYTVTEVG